MAKRFYLECTKAPGLRFLILKLNRETMHAQLLGDTGVPFERVLSDDVLAKYGYKVVIEREEEAECAST
jgi:hypothetical protein